MKNVKETMAVANEIVVAKVEKNQNLDDLKSAKKKLEYWLYGVGFSMLPLLALPISGFIKDGKFFEMLYNLFCDASILFVSISFTITSLNDFIADCVKRDEYRWVNSNLILLILGVIIYTTIVLEKNRDLNVVFGINLIYFILMFLLSLSKYIKGIRGIKNGFN